MATPRSSLEMTARGRIVSALAAVSTLGAWLGGDPNVRIAAALLAAPLLVDFARKPRELRAVILRVAPRRTVAGAAFRDEVHLVHGGRRPLREVTIVEEATRSSVAIVDELAPATSASVAIVCHGQHRGHRVERVFALGCEWPLGMFRATATAVVATDFVVEPRRATLRTSIERAVDEHLPAPQTRTTLVGDEFHALREHHADEDARGVHARRSAALGELVRTVVRGRLPRRIGIVLDLRRPPGRPLNLGQRRFEWSLGACATVLETLSRDGAIVQLFVVGSRTENLHVADGRSLREAMTLLAEVATCTHRPLDHDDLPAAAALDRLFWIPAGGYLADGEQAPFGARVQVIGSDAS